jgi:hypothetical protein
MTIEKYIYDLLFHYECVIIPGFGGLITSHCPAIIRNDEHFFYPPSKFLAFNKNLNKQDGLLANYISEKEKLSYPEAVLKIETFVKLINNRLVKGEKVGLTDIGIFSLDKEKNILFTPDEQINFLTSSFGLSGFYASPVNREEISYLNKHNKNTIVRKIFPSRVKGYHLAFAASVLLFSSVWLPWENREISKYHIDYSTLSTFEGIKKPVTAEALFDKYNPFANKKEHDSAVPFSIHSTQPDLRNKTQNVEEVHKSAEDEIRKVALKTKELVETIIVQKQTTTESRHENNNRKFYLIAGVFAQKENAENMARKLNSQGFPNAVIVDQNKKLQYRVAFDSFDNNSSAEELLTEIKMKQKRSAWILKK